MNIHVSIGNATLQMCCKCHFMLTFKEGMVYNDLPLLKRCLQKASRFPLSTQRLEFSAGTPYTKKEAKMSQWSKFLYCKSK